MVARVSHYLQSGTVVYLVLGVVHAVSYSLLLLNTDLHVAELSTHMSRNQFVRNTLTAVQTQFQPDAQSPDPIFDDAFDSRPIGDETVTRTKRSDSVNSWNSVSRDMVMTSPIHGHSSAASIGGRTSNGSTPSVQTISQEKPVYGRQWEADMESLLRVRPVLTLSAFVLTLS
jgi:hypothetical protein